MLTAFVLLATYYMSAQQDRSTGPMAKNRKPWQDPRPQSRIMFKDHDHAPITGPMAKKHRPWEDGCAVLPMTFSKREDLTGPLAKNTRPEEDAYWEKMGK